MSMTQAQSAFTSPDRIQVPAHEELRDVVQLDNLRQSKPGRCLMSAASLKLTGSISEISRAGLYIDHVERVTVYVEGAEPLYAELRLPNLSRWTVGQRLVVTIEPD
jgi:hypothetical protein